MKFPVILLIITVSATAQNISLSKDSLRVYNNPAMSSMDGLVVRNAGNDTVWIDSAVLLCDVFDTTGFGMILEYRGLDASWQERYGDNKHWESYWNVMRTSETEFYFKNMYDTLPVRKPCTIAPGDSTGISFLRIGTCFVCSSLPRYPLYLRGVLRLHFTSDEVIAIQLYSQDLRPKVGVNVGVVRKFAPVANAGGAYLINGKRLPEGTVLHSIRQRMSNRIVRESFPVLRQ